MIPIVALWTSALMTLGGPVTEVVITPAAEQTSVLIAVQGDVDYRQFSMEGPHRVVVDLMDAQHALPRDEFINVNRGGIRSVRTSQYSADIVRVVLVLNEELGYTVVPDPRGLRVVFENPYGAFEPWSSGEGAAAVAEAPLRPQPRAVAPQQSTQRRISIQFSEAPIRDVLLAFAAFSGKSIVSGSGVANINITADIRDQPWDVALNTILSSRGLTGREDEYGIIRIDQLENLQQQEGFEPSVTRAYRVNYTTAQELVTSVQALFPEEASGQSVSAGAGNHLIVTAIQRIHDNVVALLAELDRETPQVSIQAKIVFVNRTELDELGVTYELKDSRGNQLNELSDGAADLDGDGVIDPATETIEQGSAVVLLGGNSVAALGNANARVASPNLSLLTSLVIGRHQLISFLDALSSVNLSDIQAIPQVTTLDNVEARLKVGVDVPYRTVDPGSGGTAGGTFPTAQVGTEETGVILTATPHVTADGKILLDLNAERSSVELAESDVGFIKQSQEARTRVLVEDGETVVIAGLTQSERTEVRTGIPLLMDLPVIGRLFRSTREQQIQRDLIILVTPHIVRGTN